MSQKFPFNEPSITDTLKQFREEIFASMNVFKVGRIISFDKTKKTAVVELMFKKVLQDNTVREIKPLIDVPVFTLQGGTGGIQFPIVAGDNCIVLFSDRNLDAWFKAGQPAAPYDGRMHDLSDGIALVGLNALNSAAPAYLADTARMYNGAGEYRIKSNKHVIKNGTTDLLTIINALFVAVEAIQVTGNIPLTPASISALEVVKAQFATLLGTPS